jgi:hypothetical protein
MLPPKLEITKKTKTKKQTAWHLSSPAPHCQVPAQTSLFCLELDSPHSFPLLPPSPLCFPMKANPSEAKLIPQFPPYSINYSYSFLLLLLLLFFFFFLLDL